MNAIANVGRASKDVVAMSKEMFKMGVIEDVLEDTLGMNSLSAEEEDETDKEVDAILKEIAGEVTGAMPERVVKAAEEALEAKERRTKRTRTDRCWSRASCRRERRHAESVRRAQRVRRGCIRILF